MPHDLLQRVERALERHEASGNRCQIVFFVRLPTADTTDCLNALTTFGLRSGECNGRHVQGSVSCSRQAQEIEGMIGIIAEACAELSVAILAVDLDGSGVPDSPASIANLYCTS